MKIALCFGTRPEIIKMSILCEEIKKYFNTVNIFTGQHTSLYDDVKDLITNIDYKISLEECQRKDIISLYSNMQLKIKDIFLKEKPDLVIVQGDTASSYCCALCAFLLNIKIGHIEAGLRTYDLYSPFPEEFNRQMISKISYFNWCPSEKSVEVLKKENINGKIILTGNTIMDFLVRKFKRQDIYNNNIVITLHRRENSDKFISILKQINNIAKVHKKYNFIFPAHPNPNIQKQLTIITEDNIKIIKPMEYYDFINLINECRGIITDSGGIQEEAIYFLKKVLVCRDTTERMEGVDIGICRLIGEKIEENFEWLISDLDKNIKDYMNDIKNNPYGNGNSCFNIIKSIQEDQNGKS